MKSLTHTTKLALLCLTTLASSICAQSPISHAALSDPSGAVITGGEFASIEKLQNGVSVWRAQLSSDPSASVLALAASGDGGVYAAGMLTKGGFIAKVDPSGAPLSFEATAFPVRALAVDGSGALYAGGDGFIRKWGGYEVAVRGSVTGIAVDGEGALYAAVAAQTGLVSKLSPDGKDWGWTLDLGPAVPAALGLDASGAIVTAGTTQSLDLVTKNAPQNSLDGPSDAFVAKILTDGTIVWSTYLGGRGDDAAMSLAFDAFGRIVLGGMTASPDFPEASGSLWNGARDGFVAWLSADGTVIRSRYIGTPGQEQVNAIALDSGGRVHAGGMSNQGTPAALFTTLDAPKAASGPRTACVTTYTVTSTADSGAGTLRDGVANVCAGGTVDLSGLPTNSKITLTSGEIVLNQNMTIQGAFAKGYKIDGGGAQRIFFVQSGNVSIKLMTLQNGYGKGGDSAGGGGRPAWAGPSSRTAER